MSTAEIIKRVKQLPERERRKIMRALSSPLEIKPTPVTRKKEPLKWPDAAARRKRIFGDAVLPNLVLAAREEERF